MFRISALVIALVIACIPLSLAESESLIAQELIKADKVNYKTETVEYGRFERVVSGAAEEYYPYTYSLSFDESGARFVRYEVIRGDEVKKGDALAVFMLESDAVELASLEMQLADARAALDERIADEEEAGLDRQRAMLAAADTWSRELLALQAQRAELALEQYILSQNRAIAQLEERIEELQARRQGNVLTSPVDGVVIGTVHKREGDKIYPGEQLVMMYRTDKMLMAAENSNGYFRYGMEVSLEVGSNKDRVSLPGRVVGADMLLPPAERTGKIYVEVEIPEDMRLTRPIISGSMLSVEQVPLISRSNVTIEGGKHFVTVLTDGVPQKRFINCVIHNSVKQVWVLGGLEPGDEIIID